MAEWFVRRAVAADIPVLVSLLAQLFALEKDFAIDNERQAEGLRRLLAKDPAMACVLVAETSQGPVAMCSIQVVISTAMGSEAGLLEDLIVDEQYRGRGIGKALLDEAEQWCRQRGLTRLQLLADRDNHRALGFYTGLGWLETNLRPLARFLYQK